MDKIDIHADDYGLTMHSSHKILELVNLGKLTGISIMPNMSAFEQAVDLWKREFSGESEPWISVHLNFMEGYSLSDPHQLSYLVDEKGLFTISWGTLVKYNYHYKIRNKVKEQLKREIKEQLERVIEAYKLLDEKKLRVDSHQHTHMIPIVMESLLEVIKENNYQVEYIRLSRDPWSVYFSYPRFYMTYSLINIVKVFVLNWYSYKGEKILKRNGISSMLLSGVFLSGKMDRKRIEILYPKLKRYAEKKKQFLEVLFHPGNALNSEMGEEFNHSKAKEFYLSDNRKREYEAVKSLSLD